jgi:hypothetical protein
MSEERTPAPMRPEQLVLWLAGAVASPDRLPMLTQWTLMRTTLHAVCPATPAPEPLPAEAAP